jgi:hypothetical protein
LRKRRWLRIFFVVFLLLVVFFRLVVEVGVRVVGIGFIEVKGAGR